MDDAIDKEKNNETSRGLRELAFNFKYSDLVDYNPIGDYGIFGVIMEIGYDNGFVTVTSFIPGDASLYFSNGGAWLGGGMRDSVKRSAQNFIQTSLNFITGFKKTDQHAFPKDGQTTFYIFTRDGLFTSQAVTGEFKPHGPHPLTPLFAAAQDVITEYRVIARQENWDNQKGGVALYKRRISKWLRLLFIFPVAFVAWVFYLTGKAYKRRKNFNRAIKNYTWSVNCFQNPVTYNSRGYLHDENGHLDQAIADYTTAIGLWPRYQQAHINRGLCFGKKGYRYQAIADYTKVIEINPKHKWAYNNRGYCYYVMKIYDNAISDYTKAIEVDGKFALSYHNRGNANRVQGNSKQAIFDYSKAIEINPNYENAYINRGIVYSSQDENDLAIFDYNRAIEINSNSALGYNNRGYCYRLNGEHRQSIADCTKAIEIDSKFSEAYICRAESHFAQRDYLKAIFDYSKAMEIEPKNAVLYNNRGNCYYSQKQFLQAINDYLKAIDLKVDYADAYKNIGRAYYVTKEYDKAWANVIKMREFGLPIDPDFIEMLKTALGRNE